MEPSKYLKKNVTFNSFRCTDLQILVKVKTAIVNNVAFATKYKLTQKVIQRRSIRYLFVEEEKRIQI